MLGVCVYLTTVCDLVMWNIFIIIIIISIGHKELDCMVPANCKTNC